MLSSRREGMEEATLVGSSLDFAQHNPVARAAPHAQLHDPSVLVQVAFGSHSSVSPLHSSMSVQAPTASVS